MNGKHKNMNMKTVACLISLFASSTAFANVDATLLPSEPTRLYTDSTGGQTVDRTDPFNMIRSVADVTFKRFADQQSAIRQDPNLLKQIVREELVPYIDYKYAAFKVIGGKNFKKTTKKERAAFIPVFLDYLVTSYAQVFTLYNNQEVKFEKAKYSASKKLAFVKTLVIEPGRPAIDISFSTRVNKAGNEWKAYDMVAEGVSLLDSKEAELSSLIRQKGLDHVTNLLKEKAAKDIVFK